MNIDNLYINRCIQLAKKGLGYTKTNPLVGCVIVKNETIIGEGWHQQYGEAHAEVNAFRSVSDTEQIKGSTLYVNLEPCVHFGKTPPCADLIIHHKIQKVVIGCRDTFSEVDGKGIEKLKASGIDVTVGVEENKCLKLNKRFFTFHEKKRPYIILKWSQTIDGFIDKIRRADETPFKISSELSSRQVHTWRSQEQAILIGKNTLLKDNPYLNARFGNAPSPSVIVLGYEKGDWNVFKNDVRKIIFSKNSFSDREGSNTAFYQTDSLKEVLSKLYELQIVSVLVEGGSLVLNNFIEENIWDEMRVIISESHFEEGVKAPQLSIPPNRIEYTGGDRIEYYYQNSI